MISTRAPSPRDDEWVSCTSCRGEIGDPLVVIVTLGVEPSGRGARASSRAPFEIALCRACAPLAAEAIGAFTPRPSKPKRARGKSA